MKGEVMNDYKKKKLLIYISFPYWPRLETELEIVDKYFEKGYDVTILSCMGELAACPDNRKHWRYKCLCCNSRLKAGYGWLNNNYVILKQLLFIKPDEEKFLNNFINIDINNWNSLKTLKFNQSDIGLAAFSELVSFTRDSNPKFNPENVNLSKKLLKNGLIVHFSIYNHIVKEKPDIFILFNGRISEYRPALRVAQSLGVNTLVFEISPNKNKYILMENTYPHDIIKRRDSIIRTFETSKDTDTQKQIIADRWFRGRIEDESGVINPFTSKQRRGYGLEEIKKFSGLKVAIFISSEDEFVAITEHKNPYYDDQNSAIDKILRDLKDEHILFIIRAHPNLKNEYNTQMINLNNVIKNNKDIIYLSPNSEVSSYELIEACDLIITFGSTIGIETTYLGKPSILMGISLYRGLGGTIEPDSHDALVELLRESVKLGHLPREYEISKELMKRACLVYAYGLLETGYPHEYQKLTSHSEISWIEKNGIRTFIKPHFVCTIINKFTWYCMLPLKLIKHLINKLKIYFYLINT